jgi:hypothetical protein
MSRIVRMLRVPFADANCIPVPGEPGDDHEDDFVLLADAFVTGWHATELAAVRAGCTVAVFGAGAVGLLAAYSARLEGAAEVYVVDVPERLDKAGRAPAKRVLAAAAVVAAGAAIAQLGPETGHGWDCGGSAVVPRGAGGSSRDVAAGRPPPTSTRALTVTVYACWLATGQLLVAAALVRLAGGPAALRPPTRTELAALVHLAGAVTAVVFLAWFAAVERLGVERTGLFNGLIPVASLIAVAVSGTETVTRVRLVGGTGSSPDCSSASAQTGPRPSWETTVRTYRWVVRPLAEAAARRGRQRGHPVLPVGSGGFRSDGRRPGARQRVTAQHVSHELGRDAERPHLDRVPGVAVTGEPDCGPVICPRGLASNLARAITAVRFMGSSDR